MKYIQKPISENHKSAMFFDGVVAELGDGCTLETEQSGELGFNGKDYIGEEIRNLAMSNPDVINDDAIDSEVEVNIFVDKFFVIKKNGVRVDEDEYFNDMDEFIGNYLKPVN